VETSKPARRRDTEDRRREGLESKVEGFNERGRKAVRDRKLHDSISLFTSKTLTGRNAQLRAHPDAPELRERAYRAKQETMANLDYYLSQMADAIEERGGKVFFADEGSGAEA
jgi:L-lactate dehydrogenase complex protein LldF